MHDMLSQKIAEMHSVLSEQMRSALSDALEKKMISDVASVQQLVTEASLFFLGARLRT